MRKLFLLLSLVGIFFIACENDDLTSEQNISLSSQHIEIEFEPAQYNVFVTSPCSWDAISKNEWIVVHTKTGIAGTKELQFSVECNEEAAIREGTIVVKNEDYGLVAELYITQKSISINSQNILSYTSSNNEIVTPYRDDAFGASIVSNTHINNLGIIVFDAPITKIGYTAFQRCTLLTSMIIPNSVTSIGHSAFCACTSLKSITIPNSVTEIGDEAFCECRSLINITIPNSVTKIGDAAFLCCSLLQAFYGKFASADNRCLIVNGALKSFAPAGLTQYTIPNNVTNIGNSAFNSCDMLKSVTIPDSVTSIGHRAFYYCLSLEAFYGKFASTDNLCLIVNGALKSFAIGCGATEYVIPNYISCISDSAFSNCKTLKSITIPNCITSIEDGVFFGCDSLTNVYCKAITPPRGGNYMFAYNATNRKIYVPHNSVEAYKVAEGWKDYADDIVGYDF